MSTKIHQAFLIERKNCSLADTLALCAKTRESVQPKALKKQRFFFAHLAQEVALSAALAPDEAFAQSLNQHETDETRSPLSCAGSAWRERIRKSNNTHQRDPAVDCSFEIVFYPHPKGVAGICFTDEQAWRKEFMRIARARDYSYWNNTDKPDDVDMKEWRARERFWDKAFAFGATPASGGLSAPVLAPNSLAHIFPKPADIAKIWAGKQFSAGHICADRARDEAFALWRKELDAQRRHKSHPPKRRPERGHACLHGFLHGFSARNQR